MKSLITFCLLLLAVTQSKAATYDQVRAEIENSPGIQTEIVNLSPVTMSKLINVSLEEEKNNPTPFRPLHTRPASPEITFYHLVLRISDYNSEQPKIRLSGQLLDEWATGEILDMVISSNLARFNEFAIDLVCGTSQDEGYEFQVCGKGSFNRYGFTPSKVTAE
jgi:hypothetical protein